MEGHISFIVFVMLVYVASFGTIVFSVLLCHNYPHVATYLRNRSKSKTKTAHQGQRCCHPKLGWYFFQQKKTPLGCHENESSGVDVELAFGWNQAVVDD